MQSFPEDVVPDSASKKSTVMHTAFPSLYRDEYSWSKKENQKRTDQTGHDQCDPILLGKTF
jgi:hypothetical protein